MDKVKYCLLALVFTLTVLILPSSVLAYSQLDPEYSVTTPDGWKVQPVEDGMVEFYNPDTPVIFIVETAKENASDLAAFKEASLTKITKGSQEFKITSETNTTLAGSQALEIGLNLQGDGTDVELLTLLTVNGGLGYRLTAIAENGELSKYLPEFKKFAASFSFSADVAIPFRDDFNSKSLGSDWYFIREDPTHWNLEAPGYFQITTQAGDLSGSYNNAQNVLLRPAPAIDFEIATAVKFNPTPGWQQAGLVIYQDDDNYLRLTRCQIGNDMVEFLQESDGIPSSLVAECNLETTYLKIVKTDNTYTGYYSANGSDWIEVYEYSDVSLSDPKIGLTAFQIREADEGPVQFDFFSLNRPTKPSSSNLLLWIFVIIPACYVGMQLIAGSIVILRTRNKTGAET